MGVCNRSRMRGRANEVAAKSEVLYVIEYLGRVGRNKRIRSVQVLKGGM